MSKLYFENSRGQRRIIGAPNSEEESWQLIKNFCDERHFNIPYVRTWITPDQEKYYDVSSHTEFFVEVDDK